MLFSASKMPSLLRCLQRMLDDVAISTEPVRLLDKLAALDLEDLYPAAAFVVSRGDLQRRHEATQGKIADLLEAVLDISSGRRLAAAGFQRITDALDMDRGLQETTVVIDRVLVHQIDRFLAGFFVHRLDLLADRVVVAGSGELHGVIAFGDTESARRIDV